MSQQQRVYNLLAKVGKNNEQGRKMKFAIADDLNTALEEASRVIETTSAQVEAAYETVADLIGRIPSADSFYEDTYGYSMRLDMAVTRAQSAAEELGIDPENVSGYSDALDLLERFKELDGAIADYRDAIEPILKVGGL